MSNYIETGQRGSSGIVVDSSKRIVISKGIVYPFTSKMTGRNTTIYNNVAFIDGYQLVNNEWRRTLKATWHKYF